MCSGSGAQSGIKRLAGMYAFVAVDTATGEFLAARDPFGVKPLYLIRSAKGFCFARKSAVAGSNRRRRRSLVAPGLHADPRISAGAITSAVSRTALVPPRRETGSASCSRLCVCVCRQIFRSRRYLAVASIARCVRALCAPASARDAGLYSRWPQFARPNIRQALCRRERSRSA